jgi:hypothetical protein
MIALSLVAMGKLDLDALAKSTPWLGYCILNTPTSSNLDVKRIRRFFTRPLKNPYLTRLRTTIIIIIMITGRPYTFHILLAILDLFSRFESLAATPLHICVNSARQRDRSLLGSGRTPSWSHYHSSLVSLTGLDSDGSGDQKSPWPGAQAKREEIYRRDLSIELAIHARQLPERRP